MYFTGIDHPNNEPSRNKHASKERKSKFTEKVAESVVDGDLYFSMRSPAHQRFYVPVEKGEHGQDEDGLLCVTHQFRKPFPDLAGRWHEYESGGNLVITVRSTEGDITYAALNAIESALYRTPLGRAIGHDAIRPLAKSLMKTFGIERDDDFESTFTVDPVAERMAQDALRDLLTYAPEGGYDERLGEIGAEYDNVGFAKDAVEYTSVINGESDGFGNPDHASGKALPLMSQPVFYAVLGGKHEARGFQGRIDALMQAVGLEEEDLR